MVMGTVSLTYSALHQRLRKVCGPASACTCELCPKQATQWSQIHDTDGTDLHAHYRPLCRSCHARYDLAGCRPAPWREGVAPTNAKLAASEVLEIRELLEAGRTGYSIAKDFSAAKNVPFTNMKQIVYGIRSGKNYLSVIGGQ